MIIDQLPLLSGDGVATDEFPIERGTTTYKATLPQILAASDPVPTENSRNAVQSGGTFAALATKQDNITVRGILKGDGTTVSAATKGVDYGGRAFQITLAAADWNGNAQTISNFLFLVNGVAYVVTPDGASLSAYGQAQIYADAVTVTGQMTFHCSSTPSSDLTVNILRVVSA